MTGDHHGRTAWRATLLVTATDEILGTHTYNKIVVFIYDESASVQEHDTTASSLCSIDRISDVIIVSRPSQLGVRLASAAGSQ